MLLKIGWQEGESLGANNSGIQQPVSVSLYMLLSNYLFGILILIGLLVYFDICWFHKNMCHTCSCATTEKIPYNTNKCKCTGTNLIITIGFIGFYEVTLKDYYYNSFG